MARTVEILYDGDNISKFMSSAGVTISRPCSTGIANAQLTFVNRNGIFSNKELHKVLSVRLDDDLLFGGFVENVYPRVDKREGNIITVTAYDFGFMDLTNQFAGLIRGVNYTSGLELVSAGDTPKKPNTLGFIDETEGIVIQGDVGGIAGVSLGTSSSVPRADPQTNGGFLESKYVFYDDGNTNFQILEPMVIKREPGLDFLKTCCETQAAPYGGAIFNVPSQHDFYIEPKDLGSSFMPPGGELKLFPRGKNDHTSSTADPIVLVYKGASTNLNNVVEGGIPADSISLKNLIIGLFPTETSFPIQGDEWTENLIQAGDNLVSFAGGSWTTSGPTIPITRVETTFQGFVPTKTITGIGRQCVSGSPTPNPKLLLTLSNPQDLVRKTKASFDSSRLEFRWRVLNNAAIGIIVKITDSNNKVITQTSAALAIAGWNIESFKIFTSNGNIDPTWTGDTTTIDLRLLKKIEFEAQTLIAIDKLFIDSLHFAVYNPFSPVIVTDSNSFNFYDVRKLPYEVTVPVAEETAIQLCVSELKSKQTKLQGGTITIKDSPMSAPVQTKVRPGDIISLDDDNRIHWVGSASIHQAPVGFRVSDIGHGINKRDGFKTKLNLQAWYGTDISSASPDTNFLSWTRLYLPYGMGIEKVLDRRLQQVEAHLTSTKRVGG